MNEAARRHAIIIYYFRHLTNFGLRYALFGPESYQPGYPTSARLLCWCSQGGHEPSARGASAALEQSSDPQALAPIPSRPNSRLARLS